MTHTPTPLTINKIKSPVYGSDGTLVAEAYGLGRGSKFIGTILRESDAAFITKACNAHEELVAALKAVDRALGHKFDSDLADIVDSALATIEKGGA